MCQCHVLRKLLESLTPGGRFNRLRNPLKKTLEKSIEIFYAGKTPNCLQVGLSRNDRTNLFLTVSVIKRQSPNTLTSWPPSSSPRSRRKTRPSNSIAIAKRGATAKINMKEGRKALSFLAFTEEDTEERKSEECLQSINEGGAKRKRDGWSGRSVHAGQKLQHS